MSGTLGAPDVMEAVVRGFAEYCVAPIANVHPIESELTDAELATFACSTGTAVDLLSVVEVTDGDTVVITGASGGGATTDLRNYVVGSTGHGGAAVEDGHLVAPDVPGLGVEPAWDELGGPIAEYTL